MFGGQSKKNAPKRKAEVVATSLMLASLPALPPATGRNAKRAGADSVLLFPFKAGRAEITARIFASAGADKIEVNFGRMSIDFNQLFR